MPGRIGPFGPRLRRPRRTSPATGVVVGTGPVLVQHVSADLGSISAASLTFNATTHGGNLLHAAVVVRSNSTIGTIRVSDATNGTWLNNGFIVNSASNGCNVAQFWVPASKAVLSSAAVTVTWDKGPSDVCVVLSEWSGVIGFDSAGVVSATGTSASPSDATSGTLTSATDLAITIIGTGNGASTYIPPAGWTSIASPTGTAVAYTVNTTSTVAAQSFSGGSSGDVWAMQMLPFQQGNSASGAFVKAPAGVYLGLLTNLDGHGTSLISGGSVIGVSLPGYDINTLEGPNYQGKHCALLGAGYSLATAATAKYADVDPIVAHGSIPVLSINPSSIAYSTIASGGADTQLDSLGTWLANYAPGGSKVTSPIIIRWAWEFNGSWGFSPPVVTPGGSTYTQASLQAYAQAFQRLVTRVKAKGASTVLFAWTPNNWYDATMADGLGSLTGEYDIAAGFGGVNRSAWDPFYSTGGAINHYSWPDDPSYAAPPGGGKWVDLFGIDSYNPHHNNFSTFYQTVRNSYTRMQIADASQPIYVMETGTGEISGTFNDNYTNLGTLGLIDGIGTHTAVNTKAQWLTDTFSTTLPYLSGIKGWMYFNLNPDSGQASDHFKIENHDIDSSADSGVMAAYGAVASNSYYIGYPQSQSTLWARQMTDSPNYSDVPTRASIPFARTITSNTIAFAEALVRLPLSILRTPTDTPTYSDVLNRPGISFSRPFTEAWSLLEDLSQSIIPGAHTAFVRVISESVFFVDGINQGAQYVRQITDETVSFVETLLFARIIRAAQTFNRSLTDSATFSDALSLVKRFSRSLADTVSLAESEVRAAITFIRNVFKE